MLPAAPINANLAGFQNSALASGEAATPAFAKPPIRASGPIFSIGMAEVTTFKLSPKAVVCAKRAELLNKADVKRIGRMKRIMGEQI